MAQRESVGPEKQKNKDNVAVAAIVVQIFVH